MTRCSATTADGRPCRAYAVKGTDPPLCSAHSGRNRACPEQGRRGAGAPRGNQNARTHGFYAQELTPHELADLVAATTLTTVEDEVAITRVALRRLFAVLNDQPAPSDEIKEIAPLIFAGTGRIARLLRDERVLSGEATDTALGGFGLALDELSKLWNIEL